MFTLHLSNFRAASFRLAFTSPETMKSHMTLWGELDCFTDRFECFMDLLDHKPSFDRFCIHFSHTNPFFILSLPLYTIAKFSNPSFTPSPALSWCRADGTPTCHLPFSLGLPFLSSPTRVVCIITFMWALNQCSCSCPIRQMTQLGWSQSCTLSGVMLSTNEQV